jgi:hypothetical protein
LDFCLGVVRTKLPSFALTYILNWGFSQLLGINLNIILLKYKQGFAFLYFFYILFSGFIHVIMIL